MNDQEMTSHETDSTATTRSPSDELVLYAAIQSLAESPTNPRKTWGDIKDLARSVADVGVLQPLVVRRRSDSKGGAGKLGTVPTHEIVFGHRRFRAAKLAKLATVPVIVRDLTDKQAYEEQVIENSARTDLHALEEAESFEVLHTKHQVSVEEIAAKVGRPTAFVYARMKLLGLCEEARKAFYAGELSASTALYLARVPHETLQVEGLKAMRMAVRDGDPLSARETQRLLSSRYLLHLADAPFPTADAQLVPKAGSCSVCPKRTGAQPELFSDVKSKDVCTDPLCWEEKRVAGTAKASAELEAKGVKVVVGQVERSNWGESKIEPPSGYVKLDSYSNRLHQQVPQVIQGMKVKPRTAVMFDHAGRKVEIVRERDLPKAPARPGKTAHAGANDAAWKQRERLRVARMRGEDKVVAAALAFVAKGLPADKAWRLIGLEVEGYGEKKQSYQKMSGKRLVAEIFRLALAGVFDPEDTGTLLGALVTEARIDWKGMVDAEIAKVAPKAKAEKRGKGR